MNPHDHEDEITTRLRDLAQAAREPEWDGVERRLIAAFAKHHAPAAPRRLSAVWWQAAAAAVLVIAGALVFYPVPDKRPAPMPKPADAPRPSPPKEPTQQDAAPPVSPAPAPTAMKAPRERAPQLEASAEGVIDFGEFVALPGASALPDFESGRIVRVEVPLTMLPAYGLEIAPDAMPTAIEADFLVGQDGHPRAIRLTSTRSLNQE